jgi:hypothetical protein
MLSKVNQSSKFLGTKQLKNLKFFDIAQDNLNGMIIFKLNNIIQIYNYIENKYYNHDRIQIIILNEIFIKHIDSFDQNNILISNKIRNTVLSFCKESYLNILGVGGEFYVYFRFINSKNYYGISNHKSIIDDANINSPYSNNYLENYNNIKFSISTVDIIILNVFTITNSIINYIQNIDFKRLIIISCCLNDKILKKINTKFKLNTIKHIQNFKSWITILICTKKIK